jgi:hypothetical protein
VRQVVETCVTAVLVPGNHHWGGAAVVEIRSEPARATTIAKARRARVDRLFEVGSCVRRVEAVYAELLTTP